METLEYKLQKFDPGVVLLSADNRILAMNQIAQRVLSNIRGNPIGRDVLQLHPEKSKEKIQLLLRSGSEAGGGHTESPPMTMMINIPDRVLLIKVTRLSDGSQDHGSCMMFYDLTDITTNEPGAKRTRPFPKSRTRARRRSAPTRSTEAGSMKLPSTSFVVVSSSRSTDGASAYCACW